MGLVIGMLKSVRIQNFRQFRDLQLDGLAQINLITGKNNTGKTSLLEALWVHAAAPSDPGVVSAVARLRGIDKLALDGPAAWGWIFHDPTGDEGLILSTVSHAGEAESLRISTSAATDVLRQGLSGELQHESGRVVSTAEIAARALKIVYTDGNSTVHKGSFGVLGEHGVPIPALASARRNFYFLSNRAGDPEQEAKNFDQLVLSGREEDIVSTYQLIDKRVSAVRSIDAGVGRSIYVRLTDGNFLPMSVMGHGFYRAGKIATAVVSASGGIVLIDEFDDGLHHGVLEDVWRKVIAMAIKHSVQVFATTHSYECLEAAVRASEGEEVQLAFFRLERRDDSNIEIVGGEESRLRSAIRVGYELR